MNICHRMNIAIRVVICGSADFNRSAFVLVPGREAGQKLYGLLPPVWDPLGVRFYNWGQKPISPDSLSTDTTGGWGWIFITESDENSISDEDWYRARRAHSIARSLQLRVSCPSILAITPLQRVLAAGSPNGLFFRDNQLLVPDCDSITLLDAGDLREKQAVLGHPFGNANFCDIDNKQMLVLEDKAIKAFSLNKGEEILPQLTPGLPRTAEAIFPAMDGFFLLDEKGMLHLVSHGVYKTFSHPSSSLSPISCIARCTKGIVMAAGGDLWMVRSGAGNPRKIYSSNSGRRVICADLNGTTIAAVDGREILLLGVREEECPILASFSANGFGSNFSAISAIISDGLDRLFVLDGNCITSYRIHLANQKGRDESKQYPCLKADLSDPEGPFFLEARIISFLRRMLSDPQVTASDNATLLVEYFREKEILNSPSGLVALIESMDFVSLDSFIADFEGSPTLFVNRSGMLYRLDVKSQLVEHEGTQPEAFDLEQIRRILDHAILKEDDYQLFVDSAGKVVQEPRSETEEPDVDPEYEQVVIEKNAYNIPFKFNKKVRETVNKLVAGKNTGRDKALSIYEWFKENIDYGKEQRRRMDAGYLDALEVFSLRQGVCGEMAALYVTMARLAGLEAGLAYVDTDFRGKEVDHACAWVRIDGNQILVDPAYNSFDISHQKIRNVSDSKFISDFLQWDAHPDRGGNT